MSENENFKQEESTIFIGGFVILAIILVILIINKAEGYLILIVILLGVTLGVFYLNSQAKEKRFEWIKEYIYSKERSRKKEEFKKEPEENLSENPDQE